ncbi:MAG: glycosyltransferase [Acidobacteriota bacterium]
MKIVHPFPASGDGPAPELSVIVMLRNEAPTLPVCLDSLARQETSFPFEVLWIDGASTDDSVDVIRRHPLTSERPTLVAVQAPENAGMAVAQQLGAEAARGEIFVFMQADVRVLDPGALEKIRRAFDDPEVVGTSFIGLGPDLAFDDYDFWGQVFMARYLGDRVQDDFDLKLNGVRRRAFFTSGGFDVERLPLGGNDFDFSMRLAEHGRIAAPDVEAEHLHGLGKRHSAAGLLRKYCRNSEVAGATAPLYFKYRRRVPGYWRFAAQQFGLIAACAASLLPLCWPWAPLLVLLLALRWQKAALASVRSWRLPLVVPFAVVGLYAFAFYFTSGLLVGRTRYDFDNLMH